MVYDSKDSWEKFRDGVLRPGMKQVIAGGSPAPPQQTGFEIHDQ